MEAWGTKSRGGCNGGSGESGGTNWDYTCKPSGLTGVVSLFANFFAFAAVKSDGSVVTWGRTAYGGDVTISSGVSIIYPVAYAFVAVGPLNHTYGPEVTGTGSISFTKN